MKGRVTAQPHLQRLAPDVGNRAEPEPDVGEHAATGGTVFVPHRVEELLHRRRVTASHGARE